jgi:hypothetical protein
MQAEKLYNIKWQNIRTGRTGIIREIRNAPSANRRASQLNAEYQNLTFWKIRAALAGM